MKKVIFVLLFIVVLGMLCLYLPNLYVKQSTKDQIDINIDNIEDIDCIVVLGAGVWGESPSPMLRDRLDKAIELYKLGVSNKIIMSGDHGTNDYDEVNTMKEYAIENGVPSEDIFMDHAGFSTYDTVYRVKEVFGAKKIIIISQEYHLYRAVYISNKLGLKAYGISAEKINYSGQEIREFREILARDKDFIKCIFKPKPKYLGAEISLDGSGDVTNDK